MKYLIRLTLETVIWAAVAGGVTSVARASPPTDESLFIAIANGSTTQVQRLLDAGANPNARDDRGEPAAIVALHAGQPAVAEVLVKARGIDLEAENVQHQTVLMVAAYQGLHGMVEELLAADAEVNHKGWTALHFAASTGQVAIVQLLLDHAAYIDAEAPSRTTPLMMAARDKDRPTCMLLLQEGADPTPANVVGLTAANFAEKAGDQELARYLAGAADQWRLAHPTPVPGSDAGAGEPSATGGLTTPSSPPTDH